jgi:hypothetical protein
MSKRGKITALVSRLEKDHSKEIIANEDTLISNL